MKKIAFFVEGLSEQLFIQKLLEEIFNQKDLSIQVSKMSGGATSKPSIISISQPNISNQTRYFFLIVDCGGDTTVGSYIRDQREGLLKTGYTFIYGLLDIRPKFKKDDIHQLKSSLYYRLPQTNLPTKFLFSIMEIEAWFLAEENHFLQIDEKLNSHFLNSECNFNPLLNTEDIEIPSALLKSIYQKVGKTYAKNQKSISRTVNSLDYANLYFNVSKRIHSLSELINQLESHIE